MTQSDDAKSKIADYYDAISDGYDRQYDRDAFFELDKYPQNYFRLQLLVNRMAQSSVKRVYEVGTGEGSPLAMMSRMGYEVSGCDISEKMVEATILNLQKAGIESPDIQKADIEDCLTFANQIREPFDAAIAFGVIPHVHNTDLMLSNMRAIVGAKGKVFVEFRNKLFSLLTFNRYTHDFIMEDLLGNVADDVKSKTAETLRNSVDMNLPPVRRETEDGASYDEIMANYHNPFELQEQFARQGFGNIKIHWYHYHPGLPRHEKELGRRWREEAMKMEHETSGWRGYFLCSAGVIEADAL